MTTTPAPPRTRPATRWHLGSDCAPDSPVRTRAPEPEAWTQDPDQDLSRIIRLTPDQRRAALAHHEAGHAVAFTTLGIPVDKIVYHGVDGTGLGAATHTEGGRTYSIDGALVGLAAGCVAELLWLREAGLLTPERAWAAERLCHTDKAEADRLTRRHFDRPLGYGTHDRGDWETASACAHAVLSTFWGPTVRLAEELLTRWEDGDTVMPARLIRTIALS
ncbi:hypothetical protein [Nocardiopsis changdeensis]|uniref:hypothetical protein n=1 Tax=Nocardiopsis changdeensis TaxID=2831969 RepID=UPI003F455CA9